MTTPKEYLRVWITGIIRKSARSLPDAVSRFGAMASQILVSSIIGRHSIDSLAEFGLSLAVFSPILMFISAYYLYEIPATANATARDKLVLDATAFPWIGYAIVLALSFMVPNAYSQTFFASVGLYRVSEMYLEVLMGAFRRSGDFAKMLFLSLTRLGSGLLLVALLWWNCSYMATVFSGLAMGMFVVTASLHPNGLDGCVLGFSRAAIFVKATVRSREYSLMTFLTVAGSQLPRYILGWLGENKALATFTAMSQILTAYTSIGMILNQRMLATVNRDELTSKASDLWLLRKYVLAVLMIAVSVSLASVMFVKQLFPWAGESALAMLLLLSFASILLNLKGLANSYSILLRKVGAGNISGIAGFVACGVSYYLVYPDYFNELSPYYILLVTAFFTLAMNLYMLIFRVRRG